MLDQVIAQVATLAGFAALISILVNVAKWFKWIPDGVAPKIVAGANVLLVLVIYFLRVFHINYDVAGLDPQMQEVASLLSFVLSFVIDLGVSKGTHQMVKGLPVIGKSYSLEKENTE